MRGVSRCRLRWQREAGLTARARRRWLAARPRCEAGAAGFLSVGLPDVLPALQVTAASHSFAGEVALGYANVC